MCFLNIDQLGLFRIFYIRKIIITMLLFTNIIGTFKINSLLIKKKKILVLLVGRLDIIVSKYNKTINIELLFYLRPTISRQNTITI